MSTFNGIDLVLLLGVLLALYAIHYLRGEVKRAYARGFVAGNNHAIKRLCGHLGMDASEQPVEAYDHEKGGL